PERPSLADRVLRPGDPLPLRLPRGHRAILRHRGRNHAVLLERDGVVLLAWWPTPDSTPGLLPLYLEEDVTAPASAGSVLGLAQASRESSSPASSRPDRRDALSGRLHLLNGEEHEEIRREQRPVGIGAHLEENRRAGGLARGHPQQDAHAHQ